MFIVTLLHDILQLFFFSKGGVVIVHINVVRILIKTYHSFHISKKFRFYNLS